MSSQQLLSGNQELNQVKTHDVYPTVPVKSNGKLYNVNQTANLNVRSAGKSIAISPSSSVPSAAFSQATKVSFVLPVGDVHVMQGPLVVKMDYTNNAGAAVTLGPASRLIQNCSIYMNEVLIERIRDFVNYEDMLFLNTHSDTDDYSSVTNMSSTFGGSSIADGTTGSFLIPIWSALTTTNFPVGLYDNVRVRIEIDIGYGSRILYAGSNQLTLDNISLLMSGESLHPNDLADFKTALKTEKRTYRCLVHESNTIIAGSVTSGADYTHSLGMEGVCAYLHLAFVDTTSADANQYEPEKVTSFNILDTSGVSILGMYDVPADYNGYVQETEWFPSQKNWKAASKFYFSWSFCQDPRTARASGRNLGYHRLTPNYRIKFTSGATLPYDIEVDALMHASITISPDGRVELEK